MGLKSAVDRRSQVGMGVGRDLDCPTTGEVWGGKTLGNSSKSARFCALNFTCFNVSAV